MSRVVLLWGAIAAIAPAFFPAPVAAQETTRAAEIAAAQAEKAQRLTPYRPSKAEQIADEVQDRLLETPEGFYPWFDSVYSGGGFTGGAGYRHFIGDRTFVDTRGLLSGKGYKLIEMAIDSIGDNATPFDLRASGGWRDATEVAFFGVGNDSMPQAETNFHMQQAYAGIGMRARAHRILFGDIQERFENFTLLRGQDDDTLPVDVWHSPATAPGLDANPDYWRTTLSGGVDTRPSAGYARTGGLYALTYDAFVDQQGGAYSFEILQAEVIQHVPILRENWVLSFHGVAKTTVDDEDVVPYFLMPSLGSGSTLRAFSSWRFRDRHSLLMSGEFRWIPSLFLDVALFYDAGKVAGQKSDLNFSDLHHNWGLGFRFHSPLATPLRIELAHGREGFHLVFSGAAAF